MDPSEQQVLKADKKLIRQDNFTKNTKGAWNTAIFLTEEVEETILNFSKGTVKVL